MRTEVLNGDLIWVAEQPPSREVRWYKGGAGKCRHPDCDRDAEYWFEDPDDRMNVIYACCWRHHPKVEGPTSRWTYHVQFPENVTTAQDDGSTRPCPKCGATANYFMVGWWCPSCRNLERAPLVP